MRRCNNLIIGLIILFSLSLVSSCIEVESGETRETTSTQMTKPGTEGVVVHIKSGPGSQDDRHRVGMALSFALKALDSDRKVLVFFDTNGANIPLAEAESFSYEAGERQFPDTRETITRLVREGATVMVCPACLQAEGHEMEDLIAGVQPGNIDKFFEFTDGRILTMDW